MALRKLKPQQYIDEFYPGGSVTTQTVRNWIRKNRIKAERTPTGRFLIHVNDKTPQRNNVDKLVSFLES